MTDERFEEIIELKCGECTDDDLFCNDYICTDCRSIKPVKGIALREFWQKVKELNDLSKFQLTELQKYQRAEDDGLLVRLPCKAGDTVYWISKRFKVARIISGTVITIKIYSFGYDLEIFNSCGIIEREYEKVFLTREEAERALKEAQENA